MGKQIPIPSKIKKSLHKENTTGHHTLPSMFICRSSFIGVSKHPRPHPKMGQLGCFAPADTCLCSCPLCLIPMPGETRLYGIVHTHLI